MSDVPFPYVDAVPPTPEDLDRLVRFVVDTVQPVRVVLFGSAARGEVNADSDVDLMVVVPDGVDARGARRELWRRQLQESVFFGFPVDFVVTTDEAFQRKKDVFGLVYYDIARQGRTLYAA